MNVDSFLKSFDYQFPSELIAQQPASPRDSAKLLIFNQTTQEIIHDTYSHLDKYLPKNSVLVLNQTKVVPARLHVKKNTGGKATLLYISHDEKFIQVISDRKLTIGTRVTLGTVPRVTLGVEKQEGRFYFLKPSFPITKTFSFLEKHGEMPIPPYIKNSPLSKSDLKDKYQTVFAKQRGSVAAPTASLHFTKRLLSEIKTKGIKIAYVTLHVNLGTFATLTEQQLKTGKLHSEWYEIDKATAKILSQAKVKKQPVIAVGTTVVRTLESASDQKGKLKKLSGSTNLFIKPGYKFKFVDQIITNFHVPKSSLLMLVASFIGREKILTLYKLAIAKKYKLFSFGDGMYLKKS